MSWFEKYKYGEDSEICRLKQENKKLIEEIKEVKRTSGYKISELDMLQKCRELGRENAELKDQLKAYHNHHFSRLDCRSEEDLLMVVIGLEQENDMLKRKFDDFEHSKLKDTYTLRCKHMKELDKKSDEIEKLYYENQNLHSEICRLEKELQIYKQFFAGNHVEVVLDEDKKYVCFTPEDMIKLHEMKLKLYNEFYSNNKVDEVKKDD